MSEKDKTCSVGGLRPEKISGSLDLTELKFRLDGEIRKSIFRGYTTFQSGMARGGDIWGAEVTLKLREEFPHIRLVCCLPCETQADRWPEIWRVKYFNTLAEADDVITQQTHYTLHCMLRNTLQMIDSSSRLIAVHDGVTSGGTERTINYAKARGVDVVIVDPLECLERVIFSL